MKFVCEVGSFCTRQIKRKITVHADSENEASEKAIEKYIDLELKVPSSVDAGTPRVDFVAKEEHYEAD